MHADKTPAIPGVGTDPIILVDDNSTNLQRLSQTLTSHHYKVLVANNGEHAVKLAASANPALILLGIMLSGLDGYEVCQKLRGNPGVRNTKIIFLSALKDTQDKVKGLKIGAVDYIAKPFENAEVIARIETQLEIRRLERSLSVRNKQLETDKEYILDNMKEGIFGLDCYGFITFANHAAVVMIGWPVDKMHHANLMDLMLGQPHRPENVVQLAPIQASLNTGIANTIKDSLFWRHDGSSFPVSYSITPIMEGKQPCGAVVVFRDISEERQHATALQKALDALEEQKYKLAHVSRLSTMGEMAAGFAHELNQPLTAIANYAQVTKNMLSQHNLTGTVLADTIEKIHNQAYRAGEIISRIRSFVKKPDHVFASVNPNQLISDTYKLAEVDAKNSNIKIHLALADHLPNVTVDAIQIQQVVLNLIRNGMDAMKSNHTESFGIRIKTEQTDQNYVKVLVIDRGVGLASNTTDKLFSPFYTTKPDGMGIGLSICHSIIQSHGGQLDFYRHPDGYTVFAFTMPVAD